MVNNMELTYKRVNWVNGVTQVNETNLNIMDAGIAAAIDLLNSHAAELSALKLSFDSADERITALSNEFDEVETEVITLSSRVVNFEGRLTYVEEHMFSNKLDQLPDADLSKENSYVYVDNGGTPSKLKADSLGSSVKIEDLAGETVGNKIIFKERI